MKVKSYDRLSAVRYARRWALGRNPAYADFENMGGDCTNFVSQCLFAGSGVMNFTPVFGWYYIDLWQRAPAWSGVEYLWNFLTGNQGMGPVGRPAGKEEIQPGDVVQFARLHQPFSHAAVITSVRGDIRVCAHTFDALDRKISTYPHEIVRFFHVEGVAVD